MMRRLLFKVEDTFAITGRGLVLWPGLIKSGPPTRLTIGNAVDLRRPDGTSLRTTIRGIEMPSLPDSVPILLSEELTKDDVPIGTEVWHAAE
ncbi:MAG: hypothetical protein WBC44_02365 [Planctomycetaceae bacterium]